MNVSTSKTIEIEKWIIQIFMAIWQHCRCWCNHLFHVSLKRSTSWITVFINKILLSLNILLFCSSYGNDVFPGNRKRKRKHKQRNRSIYHMSRAFLRIIIFLLIVIECDKPWLHNSQNSKYKIQFHFARLQHNNLVLLCCSYFELYNVMSCRLLLLLWHSIWH